MTATAPHTPLVLHVGVTGHRPDPAKDRPIPAEDAIRRTLKTILLHIQDTFNGIVRQQQDLFEVNPAAKTPSGQLRLISSLAEGPDQWAASEALKLGYELQAPLPFPRESYARDFPRGSRAEGDYPDLLTAATAVLELDGSDHHTGEDYLATGRVVLNQSDLLIAVWDGQPAHGTGGTGQIVCEALESGIPILWVRWAAPQAWSMQEPAPPWRFVEKPHDLGDDSKRLQDWIRRLLLPPKRQASTQGPAQVDLREEYFKELQRERSLLGGCWNCFRDLVSKGKLDFSFRIKPFEQKTAEKWNDEWRPVQGLPQDVVDWLNESFMVHYAWSNQLSVYYANLYRSSFLCNYLLGAAAVFFALFGFAAGLRHGGELTFIGAELLTIATIITLTAYGQRRRWHERWIDYRTLAEWLRLSRFLALLGGARLDANLPQHLATYGNPSSTWMHWHERAVRRKAGLPRSAVSPKSVAIGKSYLNGVKSCLVTVLIDKQLEYHEDNAERLRKIDGRLHRAALFLFSATFAACSLHLLVAASGWSGGALGRWLTFANAFLPALGGALAAIRSQGEMHRVAQRSLAMQEELDQLRQDVWSVPDREGERHSQRLQALAERTANLMLNETLDWRIVFRDRPLALPA